MALSKIRDIDSKQKDVVFHYIKQIEKKCKSLNIPIAIKYLLSEYYIIKEFFNDFPKNQMIINGQKDNLSLEVYGNNNIINIEDTSITKYQWVLKLLSINKKPWQGEYTTIGVKSTTFPKEYYRFKALFGHNITIINGRYFGPEGETPYKASDGDIIEMTFDAKNKKIGWKINNHPQFWKDLSDKSIEYFNKAKFRLSFTLSETVSIQLISFDIQHNS